MNRSLTLATRHALATQRDNGSWLATPSPRITETALGTLALSLSRSLHPGAGRAAERGLAWLTGSAAPQNHHPVAHAVESALLSLALDTGGPVDVSHPAFTDEALAARARLVQAVALHRGRAARGGTAPETLRKELAAAVAAPGRLKRWTRVELWSAHALVELHIGDRNAARRAALTIAEEQSPAGDFSGSPVATALAALALQAAAPGSAAAHRCTEHLIAGQLPDGTWRFSTSDVWDTALTVRSFRGNPAFDRHGLPAAVAFLVAAQNPDGGWPYRLGVESDNDTTAAALIALAGVDDGATAGTVRAGLRHLARQQTSDGLWRTWQSAGDPPVDDVVAHVVTALDRHRGHHHVPLAAARTWLTGRFGERGRWQAGWYRGLPYATAEVLPALGTTAHHEKGTPAHHNKGTTALHDKGTTAHHQSAAVHSGGATPHPPGHPAARALAATRNPDGGWPVEAGGPSTPAATGLALAALERGGLVGGEHDETCWAPGLGHLLETQRGDGTWPGVPLMYGPRPLLTHFPTHTHAFVVDGLFAGQRRLRAAGGDAAAAHKVV
ncbi:prenyltransferase/squalene oxidase repeat-containing protein [Streptomyces rectiverticillatus]|uniref:prenyltransferase/squalene oxidase repeat-containing protein n=1 Tax=Streptomyces rectiverticillatus TaxID=173860 RepID=UPI0015C3EB7C|nr:prenyltransferase/squalene oxidase repeat-containing protein [Streptomyces rectiverticillatus]